MIIQLKTECSILATCTLKRKYGSKTAVTNLDILTPLRSQFDLILLLVDTPDKTWDKNAATYLLKGESLQSICVLAIFVFY